MANAASVEIAILKTRVHAAVTYAPLTCTGVRTVGPAFENSATAYVVSLSYEFHANLQQLWLDQPASASLTCWHWSGRWLEHHWCPLPLFFATLRRFFSCSVFLCFHSRGCVLAVCRNCMPVTRPYLGFVQWSFPTCESARRTIGATW